MDIGIPKEVRNGEHGVASLHGRSLRERAQQLIAISDPRFREELTAAARLRELLWPVTILDADLAFGGAVDHD